MNCSWEYQQLQRFLSEKEPPHGKCIFFENGNFQYNETATKAVKKGKWSINNNFIVLTLDNKTTKHEVDNISLYDGGFRYKYTVDIEFKNVFIDSALLTIDIY